MRILFLIFRLTGCPVQRRQHSRQAYMDLSQARYIGQARETRHARWVTFDIDGRLFRIHAIREPGWFGRWGFNTVSIRKV